MREYDRTDISEEIDVNKTSGSTECDISHYWYFKDIGFKYEPCLSHGCHELTRIAVSFNDVAIIHVKGNTCRIYLWYMSKDNASSIMRNPNLVDKAGVL